MCWLSEPLILEASSTTRCVSSSCQVAVVYLATVQSEYGVCRTVLLQESFVQPQHVTMSVSHHMPTNTLGMLTLPNLRGQCRAAGRLKLEAESILVHRALFQFTNIAAYLRITHTCQSLAVMIHAHC